MSCVPSSLCPPTYKDFARFSEYGKHPFCFYSPFCACRLFCCLQRTVNHPHSLPLSLVGCLGMAQRDPDSQTARPSQWHQVRRCGSHYRQRRSDEGLGRPQYCVGTRTEELGRSNWRRGREAEVVGHRKRLQLHDVC